jgi:hypothetical protein
VARAAAPLGGRERGRPDQAIPVLAERRAERRAIEGRLAGLWAEKRRALATLAPLVGGLCTDDLSWVALLVRPWVAPPDPALRQPDGQADAKEAPDDEAR